MSVIQDYINSAKQEHQPYLEKVYHILKEELPSAEEKISYGMPTFYLKENLVHFSAAKNHLGFYPTPEVIKHFKNQLDDTHYSKGAIQFPYKKPLPEILIRKMVHYRLICWNNKFPKNQ